MKTFMYVGMSLVVAIVLTACGGGGGSSSTPTNNQPTPSANPSMQMSCANNAVWSNPATFDPALQDCVAPLGVQALITSMNTMQDESCILTIGSPLTASCKAYFANGTMLVASNGSTVWMAYVGKDGASYIGVVDVANMKPVAVAKLAYPLSWIIANPSGVDTEQSVKGVSCNYQQTLITSTAGVATILQKFISTPRCTTAP